jgi:Rad3-related DNA helicase
LAASLAMLELVKVDAPACYLFSPTKMLATQYEKTFNGLTEFMVARGKTNYQCIADTKNKSTAEACKLTKMEILTCTLYDKKCFDCGYFKLQRRLLSAEPTIFVGPTAWGFAVQNPAMQASRNNILNVYDEAFLLGQTVASTFETFLTVKSVDEMIGSLRPIQHLIDDAKIKAVVDIRDAIKNGEKLSKEYVFKDVVIAFDFMAEELKLLAKKYKAAKLKYEDDLKFDKLNISLLYVAYGKFMQAVKALCLPTEYAFDYEQSKFRKEFNIKTLPIIPGAQAWSFLSNAKHNLFMAGTIDAQTLTLELGLDESSTMTLDLSYCWPVENKPLISFLENENINKAKLETHEFLNYYLGRIETIVRAHVDIKQSGIIIVPSFSLVTKIADKIKSAKLHVKIVMHDGTEMGERVVSTYFKSVKAGDTSLLITAGMWEGLDAANDLARYVILPKAPVAVLTDVRTKALNEKYPSIVKADTKNKILQSLGRGVRNEADWCVYYSLDSITSMYLNGVDNYYKRQFSQKTLQDVQDVAGFLEHFKPAS